jgi:hypothetical protein
MTSKVVDCKNPDGSVTHAHVHDAEAPPCPGICTDDNCYVHHMGCCPGCGTAPRLTAEDRLNIEVARHRQGHGERTKIVDVRTLLAILDRLAPPQGAPRG